MAKPSPPLHKPHDGLFKIALKHKVAAYDFLAHRLSKEALQTVDLKTLHLEEGSYISKEFRATESDIVYGVATKEGKGYVYLLMEQQTKEDHTMPLRLMRYNLRLMEQHIAQHGGKLPAVFNVVLYTSKNPYKGAKKLEDAFQSVALAHEMLRYTFLIDLHRERVEELLQDGKATLMEWALRDGRKDPCKFLEDQRAFELLAQSPYGEEACLYLLEHEPHEPDALMERFRNLPPNSRDYIMTAIQRIEERGMQRGMQQGMQRGMHKRELAIARKMQAMGMDFTLIRELTGVKPKELAPTTKKQ